MSLFDIAHEITTGYVGEFIINSNTTTFTPLELELPYSGRGFFITALARSYTDGDYEITLQEADEIGGTFTDIPSEKLISSNGNGNIVISSANATGSLMETLGAFANKKIIRGKIVSTNVTTGAVLQLILGKMQDNRPYTT